MSSMPLKCDKCKNKIDSNDTETLLVISSILGKRYERFLCGKCGDLVKVFLNENPITF